MGEIEGKGVWYCVKGGMGALSEYLAKLARERGVKIKTDSDVDQIITYGLETKGVKLKDGTIIEAPIVISNTTHHVTFNQLIKEQNFIPTNF